MVKRAQRVTKVVILALSFFGFSFYGLKAQDASNNYPKAFYALSSLRFYLKQSMSSDSQKNADTIAFDESDVANLWDTASSYGPLTESVQEAQECYYQATTKEQYKKVSGKVKELWSALNCYQVEQEVPHDTLTKSFSYPYFDANPSITQDMRNKMRPYLLPLNHKLKDSVDKIFSTPGVLKDESSLSKAGFITLYHQKKSLIRVVSHPSVPGYLFKLYLDNDELPNKPGWYRLTQRCEGVKNVRRLIKNKKLVCFSVPDKWLYPVPFDKNYKSHKSVQPVVLIVTDMHLVSKKESTEMWRNKISTKHLDELYIILSHGFASAYLPSNIPYSTNGTFACIDTEYPKRKVNYSRVNRHLSPPMQAYWNKLVKTGGKNK